MEAGRIELPSYQLASNVLVDVDGRPSPMLLYCDILSLGAYVAMLRRRRSTSQSFLTVRAMLLLGVKVSSNPADLSSRYGHQGV